MINQGRQAQQDSEKIDLSWQVNEYINEYIRFADTKGVIYLGFYSAAAGYLATVKEPLLVLFSSGIGWRTFGIVAALAFGAGVYFAFNVIHPRTNIKFIFDHVSFVNINTFQSPEDYLQSFSNTTIGELGNELVRQNYFLSKIASEKFNFARLSTLAIVINLLFWLITIIFMAKPHA